MGNLEAISDFIRSNRKLCNMLDWEANEVRPRAWGPNLAVSHILRNPKRRERVRKELEKYAQANHLAPVVIAPGEVGNPYFDGLALVICDFRKEWEL
jgi:hypothetical protein